MPSLERVLDLLAARATEGLSAGDSDELEQALTRQEEPDVDDLELAAAAVYLAFDAGCGSVEAIPEELKQRVLSSNS